MEMLEEEEANFGQTPTPPPEQPSASADSELMQMLLAEEGRGQVRQTDAAQVKEGERKSREAALLEQMDQEAFENEEAQWNQKHPFLKRPNQVVRGMARTAEKMGVNALDMLGIQDKEDHTPIVGRSSGSPVENVSEYLTPIPGAGTAANLLTRGAPTLAKAMAASGLHAGSYGALTSDADTTLGRVVDTAQAVTSGALLGGVGHGVASGMGKLSNAGKRLEAKVATLGADRISQGPLTLAKRAGDDLGSKMAVGLGKMANRGKKAHIARDRDQRYLDDILQLENRSTYKGIPGAVEAGSAKFLKTRNMRRAVKDAEKVSNNYFKNSALLQTGKQAEARDTLVRTVNMTKKNKDKIGAGRPSQQHAIDAGNTQLAKTMEVMPNMGFTPVKRPDKYEPATWAELAAETGAIFSGVPSIQAAGIYGAGVRGLKKSKHLAQRHKFNKSEIDKGNFRANVADLADLPPAPKIAEFLLGNTEAQQKYRQLVSEGSPKALEQFLKGVALRMAGDQDAP